MTYYVKYFIIINLKNKKWSSSSGYRSAVQLVTIIYELDLNPIIKGIVVTKNDSERR